MSKEIFSKTAAELSVLLEQKALSSEDIVNSCISQTEASEDKVSAFLAYDSEDALKQAKASDERRRQGKSLGPLDGIPVGVKDVISVTGQSLTCGSKMLKDFISPYDATSIVKLKEQGAVLYGRLNMDEFAMGSSTENSAFKTTSNPWNLDYVPGGSSGGSAACVAAAQLPLSLGTDTGGSIRQPAAFCGVVGMKPTYGLVSRYGMVAYASSLEQIGPMARSVEDTAHLLKAIAGHDPLDSTSYKIDVPDYAAALKEPAKKWKLGVPKEYFGEGLDDSVKVAVEKAISFYKENGCEIQEISLPNTDLAVAAYYVIAPAEASSNLARFDGVRYTHRSEDIKDVVDLYSKSRGEGFGAEVKRRIILGTYVLSSGYYDAYYLRAQKVRSMIRDDFSKAFNDVDAIICPVSPTTAFKKGDKVNDPIAMYMADIYTIPVNLAGLPAISVPCGFDEGRMPIGVQLIGKPYQEASLLQIAQQFEQAHNFAGQYAAI